MNHVKKLPKNWLFVTVSWIDMLISENYVDFIAKKGISVLLQEWLEFAVLQIQNGQNFSF
jgi:hypothetical protein